MASGINILYIPTATYFAIMLTCFTVPFTDALNSKSQWQHTCMAHVSNSSQQIAKRTTSLVEVQLEILRLPPSVGCGRFSFFSVFVFSNKIFICMKETFLKQWLGYHASATNLYGKQAREFAPAGGLWRVHIRCFQEIWILNVTRRNKYCAFTHPYRMRLWILILCIASWCL